MSEADVKLIRRAYEAWADEGPEALFELADPNIEWYPPPEAPEPGPFRGHDQIRRQLESYAETFEEFRPELERIVETPTPERALVFATTHTRGKGSGAEVSIPVCHMIDMRDGLVTRVQIFTDRDLAIREAGLDPDTI